MLSATAVQESKSVWLSSAAAARCGPPRGTRRIREQRGERDHQRRKKRGKTTGNRDARIARIGHMTLRDAR